VSCRGMGRAGAAEPSCFRKVRSMDFGVSVPGAAGVGVCAGTGAGIGFR